MNPKKLIYIRPLPFILAVLCVSVSLCLKDLAGDEPAASRFDASTLEKVDVDVVVKMGFDNGVSECQTLIQEADQRIAEIRQRKGYTPADLDILTSPWVKTKEFVELIRQGRPLPRIPLAARVQRNGVFDVVGTEVFKGDATRAVEIVREIGLKDAANGQSWSDLWGIMERTATVLGKRPSGDLAVRVDVILGMNKSSDFIFKKIYNVRDVERYAEHDLGNGAYVVIQDLIQDDSAGAAPRRSERKQRPAKAYYPIKEQISITVIRDNKNGTFTLGNFMSTHGQELKAFLIDLFVDLKKIMEKDSVANRQRWNELFQKEVLKPASK